LLDRGDRIPDFYTASQALSLLSDGRLSQRFEASQARVFDTCRFGVL